MSTLPVELYGEVLRYVLSLGDLCALSVTSSAIQVEAERLLYRELNLSSRTKIAHLCSTLSYCTRVQPLVHSLVISATIITEYWGDVPDLTDELSNTLARCLRYLRNLKRLSITDAIQFPSAETFRSCTFSLRELRCDIQLNEAFVTFLRTQTELEYLTWSDVYANPQTIDCLAQDPPILPRLSHLATNDAIIAHILSRRCTLTHLWIYTFVNLASVQTALAMGSRILSPHLRSLRWQMPHNRLETIQILNLIAELAPEIRSLGFLPALTTKDMDLISSISAFCQLNMLLVSGMVTGETVRALAEACPSLRAVACLHYSYSHEYVILPVNPTGTPRPVHDPEFRLWKDV